MNIAALGTVAMDVILQVDSLPSTDGFAVVKSQNYVGGGSAANVIVQASHLGAKCGFIAQIGNDEIGRYIKEGLEKENVNTSNMKVKDGGTSLHTNIVVGEDGNKFILLNMGDVFLSLEKSMVNMDYIKSADIFYTDLLPGEAAMFALEETKKAGLTTVFNLQVGVPTMNSFGIKTDDIFNALKNVDVFAPCREAFYQLTETKNYIEGIKKLQKEFKGIILLTLGSEGVLVSIENRIFKVPANKVEVVDTTGAGDSFIGAFMYAYYICSMEIEKAVQFSNVCASLTCTELGARKSPFLDEVKKIIKI